MNYFIYTLHQTIDMLKHFLELLKRQGSLVTFPLTDELAQRLSAPHQKELEALTNVHNQTIH